MSNKANKRRRKRIGNSCTQKSSSNKKGTEMKSNVTPGFSNGNEEQHGFIGTLNKSDIEVPAIILEQNGKRMVIGSLTPKQLEEVSEAAYYNDSTGYQRLHTEGRSEKFEDFILKGGISPPNVVLNDIGNKSTEFILDKKNPNQGRIIFKKGKKVNIVDGQTRGKGLVDACKNGLKLSFQIPFSLTFLSKSEEALQFCTINDEQQSVKKSHLAAVYAVYGSTTQQEGRENELSEEQIKRGIISDALRQVHLDKISPLYDIFILPDEYKYTSQQKKDFTILKHRRWVGQESFLTSLNKGTGAFGWLCQRHFVQSDDAKDRANILANILKDFYASIKDINPDAFNYAKNHVILKGPGIYSLMGLLPKLLEYLKIKGLSFNKTNFSNLLSNCRLLYEKDKWESSDKRNKKKPGWVAKNHGNQAAYDVLTRNMYNSIMSKIEEKKLV